jgi:hypothetical protein
MTFRYRRLSPEGDMQFGRGIQNFLVDSPAAVAQAIMTRLNLWTNEWFLDLSAGTPWMQQVLGKPRQPGSSPDAAIRSRILGTPYVTRITNYASNFNSTNRSWTVSCRVFTAFGSVTTAPAGASISPSGALVMQFGPSAQTTSATALAAPNRRLAPPLRRLTSR